MISEAKPYKCHTFLPYSPALLFLGTDHRAVNKPLQSMEKLRGEELRPQAHGTN